MAEADSERQIKQLVLKSYFLALLCFPIILWQAWRLNRRVLRITEAEGLSGHINGSKPALRVLLLGESTSAGVGVQHNEEALAGHLSQAIARQSGRSVHWRVIGLNGYTAQETRRLLCPQVASYSADLVVIVHGFNDTVNWTSPEKWRREIRQIVSILDTRLQQPQFILTGIPPFQDFPLLAEPTRTILGLRSHALELASETLSRENGKLKFLKLSALPASEYYCIDGFHPSSKGYAMWADKLAAVVGNQR